MLIEYDLTKQKLPNLGDDATNFNITNIGYSTILDDYQRPTYDAGVVGTHKLVGRSRLKQLNRCTEFKYMPIHSLDMELSISSSYGVADAVVDSIECYNESGDLIRTIENPGMTVVNNKSVGYYLLDLTDGAIDFTFNITVNQKEPYNNQYSNVSPMINCMKIFVEDSISPVICIDSESIVLNTTNYSPPYVNITYYPDVKPGDILDGTENSTVYNAEFTIFSIPEIAYLPFEDGAEQEFEIYYSGFKYPFNITMEAYDKDDNLLSTCDNEIVNSATKPKFIHKEGLNYVKAKITCRVTYASSYAQFRYPISYVHFIPDEIKYGVVRYPLECDAYGTTNKEPVRCQLTTHKALGYPDWKYTDEIPEAFEYHTCILPAKTSLSSSTSMEKWKVYKEGDIVDIIPGSGVIIIPRKISPEGHDEGSNYTGNIKDVCFIVASRSGDSDEDGTTQVEMTIDASRITAINNDLLTDSKRVITQEDATVSETNREVVYGDDIQADIKRYSTKPANIVSDTNRTVEKVNRIRVKADTQRNKRKRIEVRYDLSRKLLGHKDNVYISSSLVPLEKAISKKLY